MAQEEEIEEEDALYLVNNLRKKELKQLLFFLKKYQQEGMVTVRTSAPLDSSSNTKIRNLFATKKVTFQHDPALGAGIQVYDNDNEMQLSVKGYIEKILESARNAL